MSAMLSDGCEVVLGGGGGVGCFLNGKSSAAIGTLPKKKRLHQTKRPVGNNAGRGLLGHLWASFQAAVTSYKSFYGDTLNRGPHQGQELLHFCLNGTSARG